MTTARRNPTDGHRKHARGTGGNTDHLTDIDRWMREKLLPWSRPPRGGVGTHSARGGRVKEQTKTRPPSARAQQALRVIAAHEDGIRARDLAAAIGINSSQLTSCIDQLVRRDLITYRNATARINP